jgi:hypothetical protein
MEWHLLKVLFTGHDQPPLPEGEYISLLWGSLKLSAVFSSMFLDTNSQPNNACAKSIRREQHAEKFFDETEFAK